MMPEVWIIESDMYPVLSLNEYEDPYGTKAALSDTDLSIVRHASEIFEDAQKILSAAYRGKNEALASKVLKSIEWIDHRCPLCCGKLPQLRPSCIAPAHAQEYGHKPDCWFTTNPTED